MHVWLPAIIYHSSLVSPSPGQIRTGISLNKCKDLGVSKSWGSKDGSPDIGKVRTVKKKSPSQSYRRMKIGGQAEYKTGNYLLPYLQQGY
jgi:hypothetical protein